MSEQATVPPTCQIKSEVQNNPEEVDEENMTEQELLDGYFQIPKEEAEKDEDGEKLRLFMELEEKRIEEEKQKSVAAIQQIAYLPHINDVNQLKSIITTLLAHNVRLVRELTALKKRISDMQSSKSISVDKENIEESSAEEHPGPSQGEGRLELTSLKTFGEVDASQVYLH